MANELTVSGSIVHNNQTPTVTWSVTSLNVTMAGTVLIAGRRSIGTSEEALTLGEVATLGWAWFKNIDATNFVEIRSATGAANDIIKIKAGEFALFRFGSDVSAPFAIADTAACLLDYVIFQN